MFTSFRFGILAACLYTQLNLCVIVTASGRCRRLIQFYSFFVDIAHISKEDRFIQSRSCFFAFISY